LALSNFSSQNTNAAAKKKSITPWPTSPNMTPNKNGKVTNEKMAKINQSGSQSMIRIDGKSMDMRERERASERERESVDDSY
jgi:hypothetical protein